MKKGDLEKKTGFTIIETSLVLAIAGLIFLMVFIALPALQRGQRDAKRREDVDTLLTAIKKYQTNNRGALPTGTGPAEKTDGASASSWGGFLRDYMNRSFEDPGSGTFYKLNVATCDTQGGGKTCTGYSLNEMAEKDGATIQIVLQASCSGDEATGAEKTSNPRKLAALYKLEGGGVYCANT